MQDVRVLLQQGLERPKSLFRSVGEIVGAKRRCSSRFCCEMWWACSFLLCWAVLFKNCRAGASSAKVNCSSSLLPVDVSSAENDANQKAALQEDCLEQDANSHKQRCLLRQVRRGIRGQQSLCQRCYLVAQQGLHSRYSHFCCSCVS